MFDESDFEFEAASRDVTLRRQRLVGRHLGRREGKPCATKAGSNCTALPRYRRTTSIVLSPRPQAALAFAKPCAWSRCDPKSDERVEMKKLRYRSEITTPA
jgi:hypothetical protein